MTASIPSPAANGVHVGPFFIHAYGLAYVVAILAAVLIASRRWERAGGDRGLVQEVALWGVPAGLIGGRLYFLATSWNEVPPHWWGPFAVWDGGLGIWGGIAAGTLAGLWVLRRHGADIRDSSMPRLPRFSSPRQSGGSATTSTRSCSAVRPASLGASDRSGPPSAGL